MQILSFELAGQRFGIPLRSVREVVRAVEITPVPGAPAVVEGVIDVRGELVPVFDLRARFGLPARPLWPTQHLVLAAARARFVALRVDRTDWMMDVDDGALHPTGQLTAGAPHIAGVARLDDGLVLIHDLDTFLSEVESDTLDAALHGMREEAGA